MKVYIAGPMTGRIRANHEMFMEAKKVLEEQGHEVKTPFDAANTVWQRHHGCDYNPDDETTYDDPKTFSKVCESFGEDIVLACWADCIALLPGWEKSRGTTREIAIGDLLRKKFIEAFTGVELTMMVNIVITPYVVHSG